MYLGYNSSGGYGNVIRDNLTFKNCTSVRDSGAYGFYGVSPGLSKDNGNNNGNMGGSTLYKKVYPSYMSCAYETSAAIRSETGLKSYVATAVRWAVSHGIVKGYSETDFAPDKPISGEEIAAIMQRYASFKEIDATEKADLKKFTDSEDVSDWAKANVSWAVGYGLISGKEDNKIDPLGNATRAETAAILQRFLDKIIE